MVTRTTAPPTTGTIGAYYYAKNPFYKGGYGMPNCTCYAWGRFGEIMGSLDIHLSTGDACRWWGKDDGYQRGQNPAIGAVMCWKRTDKSDGGHVAIVEEVYSPTSVKTSESGWQSYMFKNYTRNKGDDGTWGKGSLYKFQGFIYNPNTEGGIIGTACTSEDNSSTTETGYKSNLYVLPNLTWVV